MKQEDLVSDERPYDAEYEEYLKEVEMVRQKASEYWDTFHRYDKYPLEGKDKFIEGFVSGWYQRAGLK